MIRFSFFISLVLAVFITGCATSEAGLLKEMRMAKRGASPLIEVGGRSYRLYVPRNLPNNKVPLLLALHGGFGNSEHLEYTLGMNSVADRRGFIVAYPNGTEGTSKFMQNKRMWNAGNCCGVAAENNVNDVQFLANVINDVKSRYSIDSSRVYITGHSNGAMMSYRFMCERPEMVAAVVGVSGQLTANSCKNAHGISVLQIHGDNDDRVPYQGGKTFKSAKGVNFRSVFQTRNALENSGAKVEIQPLPRVGHKMNDIKTTIEQNYSKTLAQMIADYVENKRK